MDYSKFPSPCYVLEERLLRKNLELIKSVKEKAGVEIILAFKAFATWKAFPIVREYIPYSTASSLCEARLAYEEMGSKAHTYAPVYREDEFAEIASYSSHITFNSVSHYKKYVTAEVIKDKPFSPGLRINPEFSVVETDLYNPCGRYSRLGVTLKEFRSDLLEGIEGLHFHALCEQNADALESVLFDFEKKFSKWIPQMKWVNFGGGHHITRKDYDIQKLKSIIINFKKRYPTTEVILEPGEAIGWQTGELVATVGDIVKNEIETVVLNVSISAHMPDCLEMPYRPNVIGAGNPGEKTYQYRLAGNSCLAGDVLGDYSFDKPLQVGDKIIFEDMIHYTMVKTTFFNGVKHPSIGIWDNDQFTLLREFSYEQFKNKLG